ncbi:5'-adenylylsulfate reductase-like 5 [Elaeis guineensis]|uniref:5'-adenylylsulfate reductase-like 5 n=1 Tax=Elaeis guineensis var. tenera TaxID=51953 RepID=A0A6I9RZM0_ELAGV|nr:5'-adenylylsulfate reductase-like 5 [Elaeis guineensis]
MAVYPLPLLLVLSVASVSFSRSSAAAMAAPLCLRSDIAFLDVVKSQCPLWIEPSSPLEVSGETLEQELSRSQKSAYYSVFFSASWCPFSSNTRPVFNALSSMFPQIKHLAVEESSSTPSVFSRYGIHSFPAILLTNGTMMVRYRGSKDIKSLVNFYKKTTGFDPVSYFAVDQPSNSRNVRSLRAWHGSLKELIAHEPYIAISLLFVCLKAIVRFFCVIFAYLRAFWFSLAWQLNLGILGEWSQLLERAQHVLDIKKLWSKLRLCNKTGNFRKGANNARAWASSLASVSLGESSASRVASLDS